MEEGIGEKKKPVRRCVVCFSFRHKEDFIRLAKLKTNELIIDEKARNAGKGVYVCKEGRCLYLFLSDRKLKKRYHSGLKQESLEYLRNIISSENTMISKTQVSGK